MQGRAQFGWLKGVHLGLRADCQSLELPTWPMYIEANVDAFFFASDAGEHPQ